MRPPRGASSRMASVPAAESRRVRARSAAISRARRRPHGLPAARPAERRFRQRRRLADVLADADGGLSARGETDHRARGRRSGAPRARPTSAAEDRIAAASASTGAPLGTRGGLAVVHTFPADGDYVFASIFTATPRLPLRRHRDRRADRSVDRRRTHGAPRHQPEDGGGDDRAVAQDAADSRRRPGRSASPPRSCSVSKGRSTI